MLVYVLAEMRDSGYFSIGIDIGGKKRKTQNYSFK